MKIGAAHKTLRSVCPSCTYEMDCASGVDHDRGPKEDDVTLCFGCGEILLFLADLSLQKPDPMQLLKLQLGEQWPRLQRIQQSIHAVNRGRLAR